MRIKLAWLCIAAAVVFAPAAPALSADPPRQITETKDRLTQDEMEALVGRPFEMARAGDLAAAKAALEALLDERGRRHGENSREVSDTLYSWMILLFNEGAQTDNKYMQLEAIGLGPRAAEAVARAWGPDHPEFALVLTDFVQMAYLFDGENVSNFAESVLEDAYRIRLAALGETHKETVSTLIYLGRIQGLKSRTGGNLERAAPAIATLKKAIADLERGDEGAKADLPWARMILAQVYENNGAPELAREVLEEDQADR